MIDPDTVMVKFLNAVVAHNAMLRARWFNKFACDAVFVLLEHYIIIWVSFESFLRLFFVLNHTRSNHTRFVKAVETQHHQERACVLVIIREIVPRTKFGEANSYSHFKAT